MKIVKNNFEIEFIHEIENHENGNEDIVITHNEIKYSATIFTLSNIKSLMDKFSKTEESGNGLYFYCPDMIIVKDLKRATVIEVISKIIEEGEIENALKKIS